MADPPSSKPRWVRGHAYRDLWLFVISIVVVFAVYKIDTEASNTRHALCTFRGDLERRVQSSRDFLRDHPKGIPGIPSVTIRTGITNQQRTIDALQDLECEEG